MNTRDVARHLFAYAALLRSEKERLGWALEIGIDHPDAMHTLTFKLSEVEQMANELWEMKEKIGPSGDEE